MIKIETTKKYLLVKRYELIKKLRSEGYNCADIGVIFNVHRSIITRMLANKK